jgi:hypothetical protein
MSKAWKDFEREVAETFHGRRNIRVSYGESTCDVIHPTLALECKYGKQVPKYLCVDRPVCYQVGEKNYFVSPVALLGSELGLSFQRGEVKFLSNGLKQAGDYPENMGKIPVLCVKKPRQHGFVIAFDCGVDEIKRALKTEKKEDCDEDFKLTINKL